jgi:4-diphosphocytidyl-2-C-methyl-D-erythritol kinase
VSKRSDGFHNIETVFYPINICDALEIIVNNSSKNEVEFTSSGLAIDGHIDNNLCVKAYKLLNQRFDLPSVKIHLHKTIPMGAGLGGGSANAAFTLCLLNQKFNLNITQNQLLNYALQLGSDCPFFIINKPCFATSRGEEMQPISLDLSAYKIVIVNPTIHISTAQAFANIVSTTPIQSIQNTIATPIQNWKNRVVNDFEAPVLKLYPDLQKIKEKLYNNGAVYAAMSGTGSTFYGIFNKEIANAAVGFNENYFVKTILL